MNLCSRPAPAPQSPHTTPFCGGPPGPGACGGSVGAGAAGAAAAFVGTAVVINILSPQITGEDCPRPGIGARQAMFLPSLHSTGASPRAMPFSLGPRQRGQSSSAAWGADLADFVTDTAEKHTQSSAMVVINREVIVFSI